MIGKFTPSNKDWVQSPSESGHRWTRMNEPGGFRPFDPATLSRQSRWLSSGSFPPAPSPIRQLFSAAGSSPIGFAICEGCLRLDAAHRKSAEISNIPPDEHPDKRVYEIVGSLASTVEARLKQVFRSG